MPTIRRHSRGIVSVLLIGFALLGTRAWLQRYFAVPLSCGQPCADAVGCEPLSLTFELTPTKIKAGQSPILWYRAELRNRTCFEVALNSDRGFIYQDDLRDFGVGFWLTVYGPDGKIIERRPPPRPDEDDISWDYGAKKGGSGASGTIYPYQVDLERIERRRTAKSSFADLGPGESVSTISPIVRPYRIVATSNRTPDGGIADGFKRVRVENPPKFPEPPEGFNFLDRYSFDRPGRYVVRSGFNYTARAYKVYPRWNNRPFWMALLGIGLQPETLKSQEFKVQLASPPVTVEVVR